MDDFTPERPTKFPIPKPSLKQGAIEAAQRVETNVHNLPISSLMTAVVAGIGLAAIAVWTQSMLHGPRTVTVRHVRED